MLDSVLVVAYWTYFGGLNMTWQHWLPMLLYCFIMDWSDKFYMNHRFAQRG